eukprot:944426-Amphidinium_carterae.1
MDGCRSLEGRSCQLECLHSVSTASRSCWSCSAAFSGLQWCAGDWLGVCLCAFPPASIDSTDPRRSEVVRFPGLLAHG